MTENDATAPYAEVHPGDLLTAETFNGVQVKIKNDIADQIEKALGEVNNVAHCGDTDTLEGKTLDEITKDIIQKALEAIPKKTGRYQRIFKRLRFGEERVIEHRLGAFPLTDVYQLEYFPAVCATGEKGEDEAARHVNFFLYHGTERKIRIPFKDKTPYYIEIEEPERRHSRLKLADLLALYEVSYTPTTDLEELEADFWDAFFQKPNDDFDPAQYGHSPWFEKCCGERRSVKELQDRGDWDRLYLKLEPTKTVNLLSSIPEKKAAGTARILDESQRPAAPNQVQVVHYDFDTLGIRLIDKPVHRQYIREGFHVGEGDRKFYVRGLNKEHLDELKVMILLKV